MIKRKVIYIIYAILFDSGIEIPLYQLQFLKNYSKISLILLRTKRTILLK